MTRNLPGEWIDLGDDVISLAAHPTRPWVAMRCEASDGLHTVEVFDFDDDRTRSVTEVPSTPGELLWVRDRVALFLPRYDLDASYVEPRSRDLDLAHARCEDPGDATHTMRWPSGVVDHQRWGADHFHHYRLTLTEGVIALDERASNVTFLWHHDGLRRIEHLRDEDGYAAGIDLLDGDARRRLVVPPSMRPTDGLVLGWSDPERFVLLDCDPNDIADTCALWSVNWHGDFHSLNVDLSPDLALWHSALSPDGTRLALVVPGGAQSHGSLVVIDANSGVRLFQTPWPKGRGSPGWIDDTTLVTYDKQWTQFAVSWVSTKDGTLRSYTLAVEPPPAPAWARKPYVPQRVAGRRLLVANPYQPGRFFLSDPVLPP